MHTPQFCCRSCYGSTLVHVCIWKLGTTSRALLWSGMLCCTVALVAHVMCAAQYGYTIVLLCVVQQLTGVDTFSPLRQQAAAARRVTATHARMGQRGSDARVTATT